MGAVNSRILVLGNKPWVGVSNIVVGLMASIKRSGMSICSAKLGGSLLEPIRHRRITERYSYTLDPRLISEQELLADAARICSAAEIVVLEGAAALYAERKRSSELGSFDDGRWQTDLAVKTLTPVVLVVDARDFCDGNMNMLNELIDDSSLSISGVIANFITNHGAESAV